MRIFRISLLFIFLVTIFSSCSVFSRNKSGCPSDGRNVGAEKLLDGGGSKKTPKYRG
jgi:hypothetical protein